MSPLRQLGTWGCQIPDSGAAPQVPASAEEVFDVRLLHRNDDRTVADRPATQTTGSDHTPERAGPLGPDAARTDTMPPVAAGPEPVVTGPRPRASLLATASLVVGVAAAMFVLSGVLAGYGIALGVLALVLAIAGVSATGRRHVAGKTDALIGLALGLGAVVLGILVLTGSLSWLTMDTQPVNGFRQWLDAQFANRF